MIEPALGDLLAYAVGSGLIEPIDVAYVRNRVLEVLQIQDYDLAREGRGREVSIDDLLAPLLDDAVARGLIEPDTTHERDLLDTAIMGCFVPPPTSVVGRFEADYAVDPIRATDRYHAAALASNYIRVGRTDRNITWRQASRYGQMDITINVSKPEKDPRDIAAAAQRPNAGYPECLLCRQNEGFAGASGHPARQNLRLIPVDLAGERWFLQYSPYRYYNEHCIVLSEDHRPMSITTDTFRRLAGFTRWLPHYLVGSNADLPIVGGSILSHDHFQGGRYEFPMDRAAVLHAEERQGVRLEVLDWPLTVLRVSGPDDAVLPFCDRVLAAWRDYDDPDRSVIAYSGSTPHNTITPVARRIDGLLRMDLVLRNNRTDDVHPDGIFHPHVQIHPVKKENIGLIEVMGLAVLPGRLAGELDAVADALLTGGDLHQDVAHHAAMLATLREAGPAADRQQARARTRTAAGDYFVRGLEHCAVFGDDAVAGCRRFLAEIT